MSTAIITTNSATAAAASPPLRELLDALDDAFGCEFHVVDVQSGASVHLADQLPRCESCCPPELLAAATRSAQPQLIAEEDAVAVLALPLARAWNLPWVAYA